jgi:hypothetical protein
LGFASGLSAFLKSRKRPSAAKYKNEKTIREAKTVAALKTKVCDVDRTVKKMKKKAMASTR